MNQCYFRGVCKASCGTRQNPAPGWCDSDGTQTTREMAQAMGLTEAELQDFVDRVRRAADLCWRVRR